MLRLYEIQDLLLLSFIEVQKRRRFHPLRNLRRIFRRRTITSGADTPPPSVAPTSSTSEKNLRSATLSSITSILSASSPSSPLTHQQLQEAYTSQSLPKSRSYANSGPGRTHRDPRLAAAFVGRTKDADQFMANDNDMYTTTTTSTYHHHHSHGHNHSHIQMHHQALPRQPLGVAVMPSAMSRKFFTERQKLRSVGDSSQDLESVEVDNCAVASSVFVENCTADSASGGEMTDSQRSLSEGLLVDSGYSRDQLSQSHDSVFSESATASSLSIVLKAELADVLRKRRTRTDVSDEDLGLPRSPVSPQRRDDSQPNVNSSKSGVGAVSTTPSTAAATAVGNQSEVSSLSLLSMNSSDCDDFLASSTANNSAVADGVTSFSTTSSRYSRTSLFTSMSGCSDLMRQIVNTSGSSSTDPKDEVDLFSSDWQRLSHSAAKHKMAIRPTKKKGPTRHHRRTLETSIPEGNEDNLKLVGSKSIDTLDCDVKAKTRSLPPSVTAQIPPTQIDEKQITAKATTSAVVIAEDSEAIRTKQTSVVQESFEATTSNAGKKAGKTTVQISSSASNKFDLRSLTEKASHIFESKSSSHMEEETSRKEVMDTSETGFLRRLITRNSKRSISKTTGSDELDINQSDPKKMQFSVPSQDSKLASLNFIELEKTGNAQTPEKLIREVRKDKNRENGFENNIGVSEVLKNFSLTSLVDKTNLQSADSQQPKPKSGPAARQRYVPQEIASSNTLERKSVSTTTITASKEDDKKDTPSGNTLQQEAFRSTSIIREITASQNAGSTKTSPIKMEHHFEKKPRIVGLSAFQQKISRSNESFSRNSSNNASTNSVDVSVEYSAENNGDQKQRKTVEKSRSFRTYTEQRESTVHSNMPSLPDLSLNLRVPFLNDFVLREKEYSSPSPPEAHDKSVSLGFEIHDNNLINPVAKIESAANLTSDHGKYVKNVILTTTDQTKTQGKLMSPATVMPSRSPTTSCSHDISEIEQNIDLIVKSPFISVLRKTSSNNTEIVHRTSAVNAQKPEVVVDIPTRPKVLNLRETIFSEEKLSPTTASIPLREKSKPISIVQRSSIEEPMKETERKSAPVVQTAKTTSFKAMRRSSSVVDNSSDESVSGVPEFMKIQLNRVDPACITKTNVVLAKNLKESSTQRDSEIFNSEGTKRLSADEAVEITEKPEADIEKSALESVSKPSKLTIENKVRNVTELPPKSPPKKVLGTPAISPSDEVVMRPKIALTDSATVVTNKLSLEDRKRLFMQEDKAKSDKKIQEIRNERKKSITEEVFRKSITKSDEPSAAAAESVENVVVMRKKSIASLQQSNGTTSNSNNNNNNNNNNNPKDDATPELMKVFARRSLKVKEEDANVLDEQILPTTAPLTGTKKHAAPPAPPQQNVDSDKENHSSSEEKLDKIPKHEVLEQIASTTKVTVHSDGSTTIRNTINDFRHCGAGKNGSVSNGLTVFNNNHSTLVNNKAFLPPIKANVFRNSAGLQVSHSESFNNNNNNNNYNNNNNHSKSTLDRHSAFVVTTETDMHSVGSVKTIERSSTVSEFKGIHQRRAEWEQRAKEALK